MGSTRLDDEIRRELHLQGPKSALLVEASKLPVDRVEHGRAMRSTSLVVAGLAVAAVALWRFGGLATSSGGSAALDIRAGHFSARIEGSSVSLYLAALGAAPVNIASASGGAARPFVAQLVCGPNEPLSSLIVLFGYVGRDVAPQVDGLPAGQSSTGDDGTFLFVTASSVEAGSTWTVTSETEKFEGPVAFWGVRQILPSSRASSCVVYDHALEPQKP